MPTAAPLRFAADIRFINGREFEKLIHRFPNAQEIGARASGWFLDHPDQFRAISQNDAAAAWTQRLFCCLGGGISTASAQQAGLFHLIPQEISYRLPDVAAKIAALIRSFDKKLPNHPSGLICGGQDEHWSVNAFRELIKEFQRQGIEPSYFVGIPGGVLVNKGGTRVLHSVGNDTWYIAPGQSIRSKQDLQRLFRFIHVTNGDHVYIGTDSQKEIKNINQTGFPLQTENSIIKKLLRCLRLG
jgi:hypothetical protein